jgi:hypothetical protein
MQNLWLNASELQMEIETTLYFEILLIQKLKSNVKYLLMEL